MFFVSKNQVFLRAKNNHSLVLEITWFGKSTDPLIKVKFIELSGFYPENPEIFLKLLHLILDHIFVKHHVKFINGLQVF